MAIVHVGGNGPGIVAVGNAATATRYWHGITGTPTIDAAVQLHSDKSIKFAAAATRPFVRIFQGAAVNTVGYFLGYFKADSVTPSAQSCLVAFTPTTGNSIQIDITTGGVLQGRVVGVSTQNSTGVTLANDTEFGIEAEFDVSANPHTLRWRVWTAASGWVDQTNATNAVAATTLANSFANAGEVSTGPTSGWNLWMGGNVWGMGTAAAEHYPGTARGYASIQRLLPTADLTHSFTTNDFKYNDTTGIANTATDVYSYVDDDDQTSLADFISQNVAGAGKFIQCSFGDSSGIAPIAVMVAATFHSAGTNANEMHLRVSDDGTNWTNVWGDWSAAGLDISDTTAHYLGGVLSTKPSGGAWTKTALDGLRFEWGNSDDVADIPYLDSVSVEIYGLASVSANAGNASGAGSAGAPSAGVGGAAGVASGSGSVLSGASSDLTEESALASGTGAALTAKDSIAVNSGVSGGAGAAFTASKSIAPNAGMASGTGIAYAASVPALSAKASVAAGAGGASSASDALAIVVGEATGTGIAYDSGVASVAATSPDVEAAFGSGAALGPDVAAAINVDSATDAIGEAYDSTPGVALSLDVAAGTGSAFGASVNIELLVAIASGTAAAYGPTPALFIHPDHAAGTGAAYNSGASRSLRSGKAIHHGEAVPHPIAHGSADHRAISRGQAK